MTPSQTTTGGLNTADLTQELRDMRARITAGTLIASFVAGTQIGGFAPVFAALLGWISQSWTKFQNEGCRALTSAYTTFRTARRYSSDMINEAFGRKLADAKTRFVETIHASAVAFKTRNQDRWAALAHAQIELPKIKKELWLHTFRMTADGTNVEPVDYEALEKRFQKWFCIILAIEVVLGLFIFELRSNRIFALAMSIGSAMGIMFSRHLASQAKALINGVNDANRSYKANFPNGRLDFEGQLIVLYPLSTTVKQTYVKAEITYWLTSLGLLAWRVYISATDPAAGLTGVFGSLMVIVLSSVYSWVTKYPVFQRHLQEKWKELTNDEATCSNDVSSLSKPDPDDPYQKEITAAKESYFASATSARTDVDNDLQARRDSARQLRDLQAEYEAAHDLCQRTYEDLWPVAHATCASNGKGDISFFSNIENTKEADGLFCSYVRATLTQSDLLTEAENFEPKVTLTHVSLSSVELDQLVAETERETVITSQAGPAQGSVIRRS